MSTIKRQARTQARRPTVDDEAPTEEPRASDESYVGALSFVFCHRRVSLEIETRLAGVQLVPSHMGTAGVNDDLPDLTTAAINATIQRALAPLPREDHAIAIEWLNAAGDSDDHTLRGILALVLEGTVEIVTMTERGPTIRLRQEPQ